MRIAGIAPVAMLFAAIAAGMAIALVWTAGCFIALFKQRLTTRHARKIVQQLSRIGDKLDELEWSYRLYEDVCQWLQEAYQLNSQEAGMLFKMDTENRPAEDQSVLSSPASRGKNLLQIVSIVKTSQVLHSSESAVACQIQELSVFSSDLRVLANCLCKDDGVGCCSLKRLSRCVFLALGVCAGPIRAVLVVSTKRRRLKKQPHLELMDQIIPKVQTINDEISRVLTILELKQINVD